MPTGQTIRGGLREQRFLVSELTIAGGLLAIGVIGKLPFNGTPVLFVWSVLLLWLRGEGRAVGLGFRPGWARLALLGLVAGAAWQYLSLYALEPLIARVTGTLPDVSIFSALKGDRHFFEVSLLISWTVAAVGEEVVYRGYLMRRIAQRLGGSSRAWVVALFLISVLFGLGHRYQGLSGALSSGLSGLVFGVLYLATGRSLWAPIMAHGANDTVGFALLFLGKYPGQ